MGIAEEIAARQMMQGLDPFAETLQLPYGQGFFDYLVNPAMTALGAPHEYVTKPFVVDPVKGALEKVFPGITQPQNVPISSQLPEAPWDIQAQNMTMQVPGAGEVFAEGLGAIADVPVYGAIGKVLEKSTRMAPDDIVKFLREEQGALKMPEGSLTTLGAEQQAAGSALTPEASSKLLQSSEYVKPPSESIWGQSGKLVKVDSQVTVRENIPITHRTFEISVHPEEIAKMPDFASSHIFTDALEASRYNANPQRWLDWQIIYDKAEKISSLTDAQKKASGKLFYQSADKKKPIPIVSLTRGCQRGRTTTERVHNGILPNETRTEACYGGDCWVNTQFNNVFSNFENMEVRDLEIASPEVVRSWFEGPNLSRNKQAIAKFNDGPFIRMGQEGCDSHIIANGAAEAWLEGMQKSGVNAKTIMISAAYAPITDAQYASLAKYANNMELHFSVSGWFHPNELMIRLGEFQRAKDAGLPAKLRIITNKDNISGVNMPNENIIDDFIKQYNVKDWEILETPFHDDTLKRAKGKPQSRSSPSGKYPFICCEKEWCGACDYKCMTNVKPLGNMSMATSMIFLPALKNNEYKLSDYFSWDND